MTPCGACVCVGSEPHKEITLFNCLTGVSEYGMVEVLAGRKDIRTVKV